MFRSNDIYNNFIQNVHDNAIEADGTMYDIRVMRNFCIDGANQALSSQTIYGGPAYFIRNITYHSGSRGFLKHQSNPSGSPCYHNTGIAKVNPGSGSNYHFRNNLILDWVPRGRFFPWIHSPTIHPLTLMVSNQTLKRSIPFHGTHPPLA